MNHVSPNFIADTSVIVCLLRGDSQAEKILRGKDFAITFVTFAELDVGILKANDPLAAAQECAEVVTGLRVYHGSGRTPALYARIYHDLSKRGTMIPINDIWIAAIAIETNLPILARDEHFSRIRGLHVIQC
jgi:tRNA(fMet)-specific endonuclease VapC